MKRPRFTDYWARTGRQYVPAAATDVRETFRRLALAKAAAESPSELRQALLRVLSRS